MKFIPDVSGGIRENKDMVWEFRYPICEIYIKEKMVLKYFMGEYKIFDVTLKVNF